MSVDTQLGVKQETTYGTAVTVDKFYPLLSESVEPNRLTLESDSRRGGAQFQRTDANLPINGGARGPIEIPVYNRGLGIYLKHMLGAAATAGPADTTVYTHTFTVANLTGLGMTVQTNRTYHGGSPQAFTGAGGKIIDWSFEQAVGGEAKLSLTFDLDTWITATALATASFPTDLELLSWARPNSALTIAGTPVPITSWKLSGSNGLKTDDSRIGDAHVEPVANAYRDIDFEFTGDFNDLGFYNAYVSDTNVGQYPGSMDFFLEAPSLITGAATTRPSLKFTVPKPRIDKVSIPNADMEATMQTVTGKVRYDGSSSPITAVYKTADSTP